MKKYITILAVGALIGGAFLSNISRVKAVASPSVDAGATITGNNTVTVNGNWTGGVENYMQPCGTNGIDVPLPEGEGWGGVTIKLDDGTTAGGGTHTSNRTPDYSTCNTNAGANDYGTYTLSFTADTSKAHTGTLTFCGAGAFDGICDNATANFSYAPLGGGTGKINVTSESNYLYGPTYAVTSSWNFGGSGNGTSLDPCNGSQTLCSGYARNYIGQPAGSSNDVYILNAPAGSAGNKFSLHSIQQNIAAVPVEKNPVLAFFENFFATAHADVVCGFLNNNSSTCPNALPSLTLANANDTANFIILWDPVANMAPITTPVALTTAAPSKMITISNSGGSGSTLTWTAGAPVYSGAGGWLTVTPSAGAAGTGSPQTVTLTANPVPAGNESATVVFTATSAPGAPPTPIPQQTVTVNFTAGSGSGGVTIITISPSSTVPVTTPITTTCSGGSGSYTWTATGPAVPNSGSGKNFTFSYSAPSAPTYTVTCVDKNNPGSTASAPITVTQITPICGFGASPTRIVVPGSSTLTWTCTNAVSCNIDGTNVSTSTGNMSVSPLANTTYTLSCVGPGSGLGSTATVEAEVTIAGPGVIEGNP